MMQSMMLYWGFFESHQDRFSCDEMIKKCHGCLPALKHRRETQDREQKNPPWPSERGKF
jgi:hypothetical protein